MWLVGGVALLWNAGGAHDYLMTQMGNETQPSMLTKPQRGFLDARPVWFDAVWFDAVWFDAVWAGGDWFAVAGSVRLLLRSRYVSTAFLLSLAGLLAPAVWSFGNARPSAVDVIGSFAMWFSLLVCATLIGFWANGRAMAARGSCAEVGDLRCRPAR